MIKEKSNRGFTLVELLSVIVILAIILVIAVPKIMSVITDSKKSSLETSAKMIASSAEKIKLQNKLLGKENDEITCDSVAKISSKDYSNCTITFNNNEAIVSINGIGKFNGINVCNATKNSAEATSQSCSMNASLYAYIYADGSFIYEAEVVDMEKCIDFMVDAWEYSSEKAQAVCNNDIENGNGWDLQQNASYIIYYGNVSNIEEIGIKGTIKKIAAINVDKCTNYLTDNSWLNINELCSGGKDAWNYSLSDYIGRGKIPVSVFETAGISVSTGNISITNYDISGGTNVIIPSTIDGATVVEISELAFYNKGLTSVEIPNTINKIGTFSFMDNNITSVKFPSNNITISDTTFYNNSSITYPNNIIVENTNNNFAKNSWGTISTSDKSTYNIGDRKPVSVGEYGNHIVRVSNITPCSEVEVESQTACGFVVEFEDIITEYNMNSSDTSDGSWPASEMRTYLNNTIFNKLPDDLRNLIIDTYAVSSHGSFDTSGTLENNNYGSTDKLYLLSPEEIYSGWDSFTHNGYDSAKGTSRQLDYYNNIGVSTVNETGAIKELNGIDSEWWLRSAFNKRAMFYFVGDDGYGSYDSGKPERVFGVSPAFRLSE